MLPTSSPDPGFPPHASDRHHRVPQSRQCRRTRRPPMMPPRLHWHPPRGHILRSRLNGHVLHRGLEIPHLRATREKLGGRLIGIRRMNPFHQHIPAKGRHIKAAEDRGRPKFFCLPVFTSSKVNWSSNSNQTIFHHDHSAAGRDKSAPVLPWGPSPAPPAQPEPGAAWVDYRAG